MLTSRLQYWSLKALSLIGLTLLVFALPHLMPEPPLTLYVAVPNDPVQKERLVAAYGFDRSLPVQYGRWMQRVVTGQWGQSRFYPRQVAHEIWTATGRTFLLLMWTAGVFGFGFLCQRSWRRLYPHPHQPSPTTRLTLIAVVPSFMIALVVRDTLVWKMGWLSLAHLPTFAPDYLFNPSYMILPAAALAFPPFAIWLAASRQRLLPCQPGAAPPPSYLFGQWFRTFLGGFLLQVFLTEQILAIRGLGMIGLSAFKRRDIPMVQGFLLGAGILYFLFQLIIDWQSRSATTHRQPSQAVPPLNHRSDLQSRQQLYSGLCGVATLAALAFWGSSLTPHDPVDIHSSDQLLQPSYRYLLGTDFLGRDVLSRTLEGFRSAIPRTLLIVVATGSLAALLISGTRLLPHPVGQLTRTALLRLRILPTFLFTFVAFLIFESRAWGLEIALVIGYLPLACQLLSKPDPPWLRAVHLFQVGGQALLLIAIFHLLNMVSDTSLPTWGADIRFGMTYSQRNIWLLLAPAIALVWSQYCFYLLGGALRPPLTPSHVPPPAGDGVAKTARSQPEPSQN